MDKLRDQLNNPLTLIILITIGVLSFTSVGKWWADARHHSGASQFFGGKLKL